MTPATARQIKETAALSRKRRRDETGCFLVEGWRSVQSAVDAGARIERVFISPGAELTDADLKRLEHHAALSQASDKDMARMSDVSTPPGVLAVVRIPDALEDDFLPPRTLLLDGVQDPGNVGTLIRTAAWMGIEAVRLGPGSADPFAPKVVRATMGGIWDVRVGVMEDTGAWIHRAASAGASTWVADMNGTPASEWSAGSPSVLVIGSEAHGPSAVVKAACQGAVSIPARGNGAGVESLNAAIAGAILMERWVS